MQSSVCGVAIAAVNADAEFDGELVLLVTQMQIQMQIQILWEIIPYVLLTRQ